MKHGNEFWSRVYAEHQAGGIRHADLAAKHNVNVHTLKDRFQRIRRGSGLPAAKQAKATAFVPVAVAAQRAEPQPPLQTLARPLVVIVGDDCNAIAALLHQLQAK